MFGFLSELIVKIKTLKQKQKEKQVKKLEKSKLKEQVNGGVSYSDAQKSAENDPEVQKGKEEVKKSKSKLFFLKMLGWFIKVVETVVTTIIAIIGPVGLTVILAVAVIMIAIMGFLSTVPKDDIKNNLDNMTKIENSGGSTSGFKGKQAMWSEEELALRGLLLSDKEKNYYRLFILARQTVDGTYTSSFKFTGNVEIDTIFLAGISSTETGMKFFAKDSDNRDIFKYPSDVNENVKGYGMFGINASKTVEMYYNSTAAAFIKKKYVPTVTPLTEARYAPWGVAMSGAHIEADMKASIRKTTTDDLLDKVMSAYGIKANKDKLKPIAYWVLAQAEYHGASKDEYEAYLSFLCAMWAASSDVDEERSLDRWTFTHAEGVFAEGSLRHVFVGNKGAQDIETNGDFTNIRYGSHASRIALNGKDLEKPVWGYLHDKYKDNPTYMVAEKQMLEFAYLVTNKDGLGRGMRVLNFHYGINSYIQGYALSKKISSKLVGEVVTKNFAETPGVGQGNWDGKTIEELSQGNNTALAFREYWGTSWDLRKGDMKDWRTKDKWGVPFYYQSNNGDYYYPNIGQIKFSGSGLNGCGYYMSAYIASALTGKLINPAEMASGLLVTGGVNSSGLFTNDTAKATFDKLGIRFRQFSTSMQSESTLKEVIKEFGLTDKGGNPWNYRWDYIDELLEKGGILGVSVNEKSVFTSGGHYMCITGKDKETGLYSVYTSSNRTQTKTLYSRDDFSDSKLRHGGFYFAIKK